MRRLAKGFLLILLGFVVTAALVSAYSFTFATRSSALIGEKFNFDRVVGERASEFPGIGYRFEASNLFGLEGVPRVKGSENGLTMLVILNPNCKACDVSGDLFKLVRNATEKHKVPYFACSFIPLGSRFDLKNYAEQFGFDDFLEWNRKAEIPMDLTRFQTPTHILINRDGTVLRVWPGSNSFPGIRRVMGEQIGADLQIIVETLNANEL